jgi:hypothetical protein
MRAESVFYNSDSLVEIVEQNRDCDRYSLEISYRYCDGVATATMTRDELRELGQKLIDFSNEREV